MTVLLVTMKKWWFPVTVRDYNGMLPACATGVYIDPTALVIGDVHLGAHASVWPMTVVRGDVNSIHIGAHTNIQDGSVLHVTHRYPELPAGHGLRIGDHVTVGHKVILHGCVVGDRCLIGMGAIIMDGAQVSSDVLVGAGSLVPPGKVLASGYLWLGSPVRKSRELTDGERDWIRYSAGHYVKLKDDYLRSQTC